MGRAERWVSGNLLILNTVQVGMSCRDSGDRLNRMRPGLAGSPPPADNCIAVQAVLSAPLLDDTLYLESWHCTFNMALSPRGIPCNCGMPWLLAAGSPLGALYVWAMDTIRENDRPPSYEHDREKARQTWSKGIEVRVRRAWQFHQPIQVSRSARFGANGLIDA